MLVMIKSFVTDKVNSRKLLPLYDRPEISVILSYTYIGTF